MYERRRALERAIKELEGLRLSNGILKYVTIQETKDRNDYKVLFSKAPLPRTEAVAEERIEIRHSRL